jgi:hypothetical protein
MEEERLSWDRKENDYMTNLEKAEREAEAAASSLQVCGSMYLYMDSIRNVCMSMLSILHIGVSRCTYV